MSKRGLQGMLAHQIMLARQVQQTCASSLHREYGIKRGLLMSKRGLPESELGHHVCVESVASKEVHAQEGEYEISTESCSRIKSV